MTTAFALIGIALFALAGNQAITESRAGIQISQTLPYTGPVSAFGVIGRTQKAFFEKINSEGGITGLKVKFITLNDATACGPLLWLVETRGCLAVVLVN